MCAAIALISASGEALPYTSVITMSLSPSVHKISLYDWKKIINVPFEVLNLFLVVPFRVIFHELAVLARTLFDALELQSLLV